MKKIIKWSILVLVLIVLVSLFYYVADRKRRPLISGDELLRRALIEIREHKNYPKAIALTKQALSATPDYADVQVTLGRAYLLNGNIDSARWNLQQAVIKDKKNAQGLQYLVNLSMQEKDTVSALQYLDQYVQYYPGESNSLRKEYILLLQHKEYEKASTIYKSYVARFNADTIQTASFDYWESNARTEHKAGEMQAAYSDYKKALRYHPGDSAVLRQLVNMGIYLKDYPSALRYNTVLLKQDASNRDYLTTESTIYDKLNDDEKAVAYAAKVYALDPGNTVAKKNLAGMYVSLAKDAAPAEKIRYATLALKLFPVQKDALLYLINAHLELHEYTDALKITNAALEHYPSDKVFIDKKIGILYDSGNYLACAEYLESILQKNSSVNYIKTFDEVELLVAIGFIKQQKWEAALTALQKGLSYNKNNKALLEELVNVYASQNNLRDATATIDRLLYIDPSNETYLFKKAGLLETQKQFEQATEITGMLYRKHPAVTEYKKAYLDQLLGAEKNSIAKQDWPKAIGFYNLAAATKNPGYFHLLYAMAAYANTGDSLHVLALTDTALSYYPNDSLFLIKRSLAYGAMAMHPEALAVSRKLLDSYPSDTSLQKMYLDQLNTAGKYYEKENKNDSALTIFFTAHAVAPKDTFSVMNLSAIYFIQKRYDSSIYYADMGLGLDSNNEFLLMKKASAHEQLKQYRSAYLSANRLLQLHPSAKFLDYTDYLHNKTFLNQVGITHLQSFFPASDQYASVTGIQYMRRFEKGTITAKLNYGDRPAGKAVQGGLDLYYTHDSAYYSNLFVNASSGKAFPYWQAGYSLFRNFKKGWEGELGVRYLGFDSINNYTIATSVGKYIKNIWLNLRGYYSYNTKSWYQSYQLTARQYLNDKNDYLAAIAGLGSIPDDQSLNYNFNNFSGFVSKFVGIGMQKSFRYRTTLQLFFNYTNLQVAPSKKIGQYDVYITLLRNF